MPETCTFYWALEDPNDEDLVNENMHHCIRVEDHSGGHRCACGEHHAR